MTPALEAIFGNRAVVQTLLFLQNYGEGHARRIATTYDVPVQGIYRQLKRLEEGGILVSRTVGRTRVFSWNPRFSLNVPLRELLEAALKQFPRDVTQAYYRQRQRPRRTGKPL